MPVIVTWMVETEAKLHESVEIPEPETFVGVTEQEVLLVARLTTPTKLFNPVTVIVEVPEEPARTVTVAGLAATVKSWTV